MKIQDTVVLVVLGAVGWLLGTVYYAYRGQQVLESTSQAYRINFIIAPIATAVGCILVLKLLHVPPSAWASSMLLLAIPGMLGETVILTNFSTFMPQLQASSGGRYAAFLFAAYGLALAIAECVTFTAR